MEDSERKIRSWQRLIPLAFPKFCLLLDDVPTTRKVFRPFHVASRHYLALPHRPLFREEGRSSAEDGGGHSPRDCCGILGTTPPRATRFRKTLVVDKRRAFTELPSSFERTEQGVRSYGRPLGNCNGQLLLPVFLFGTGGSNAARRREAGPCRFSCGDREDSEARAGSEARGTVATNTVPQIPLACDTLWAERVERGG